MFDFILYIILVFIKLVSTERRHIQINRVSSLESSCDLQCENKSVLSFDHEFFKQPKCFHDWNNEERYSTFHYITELYNKNLIFVSSNKKFSFINKYLLDYPRPVIRLSIVCSKYREWNFFFQHFIFCLFPFISFQLWYFDINTKFVEVQGKGQSMSQLYPFVNISLQHMLMPNNSFGICQFFEECRSTWIDNITMALRPVLGDYLLPIDCMNLKNEANLIREMTIYGDKKISHAFFRPSDALKLSSYITNSDPCRYAGKADYFLKNPTNILVINRKNYRKILNAYEIVEAIKYENSKFKLKYNEAIYFEDESMVDQALTFDHVGILIVSHGAALGNAFNLPPCSCIIELFPFGMYFPSYFQKLIDNIEIFKFEIYDTKRRVWNYNSTLMDKMETQRDGEITFEDCQINDNCRQAAKRGHIYVNITVLMEKLEEAVETRSKCIRNHPMYNYHEF